MKLFAALLLLLALASSAYGQACTDILTCNECITGDSIYGCSWCVADGTCRSPSDNALLCPNPAGVLNPTSNIRSTTNVANADGVVEIRPTTAVVELRKGVPQTVSIVVTIPQRKEVEFFYLFDLSGSMGDDLRNVKNLGNNLRDKMQSLCRGSSSISSDCHYWRLGSHVDRPNGPFGGSGDYEFRIEGIASGDDRSFGSFGAFSTALGNAATEWGNDFPESQYSSMLQSLLCVNWNPARRHILLLATDATGHMEFDSNRLSSATAFPQRRALQKCHVTPGTASSSSNFANTINAATLDHEIPSWPQIKAAFLDKNVVPILAITAYSSNNDHYDSFINALGFGGRAGLSGDSSNVLSVIESVYNQIVGTIKPQLFDNGMDKFVRSLTPAAGYTGLSRGDSRTFTLVLEDDELSIGYNIAAADVRVVFLGLGESRITLVPSTCNCPVGTCPGACSSPGTASCECGRCNCAPGWSGPTCSCNNPAGTCPNACSGRGTCVCGACQCNAGFTGASCECIDSCPTFNGVRCNGQGTCVCGQCQCNAGYNGTACECAASATVTCASLNSCSGHGVCTEASTSGSCIATCRCNIGWSGPKCDCSSQCANTDCNPPRGQCVCGQCQCATGWDPATNCSCSTASCPRDQNNVECGGIGTDPLSHASACTCDKTCVCKGGWTGPACNCSTRCPGNCNGHGTCNCGVCQCDSGWSGVDCKCSSNTCPVGTNGLECSGFGTCICGQCVCDALHAGPACGCVKGVCPSVGGVRCNGGDCDPICGICTCPPGKTGPACDCDTVAHPCPTGNSTSGVVLPCSGQGTCLQSSATQCGICLCNRDPLTGTPLYTGSDCSCPTSGCIKVGGQQCNYPNGECDGCKCKCKPGYGTPETGCSCKIGVTCPVNLQNQTCSNHGTCDTCNGVCICEAGYTGRLCNRPDPDPCGAATNCDACSRRSNPGCVWCDDNNLCMAKSAAIAECYAKYANGTCPTSGLSDEAKAGIAGGVGGGLAAAGLLALLAYKLYGMLMDKREWQKFEQGRQASQWKSDNNPLFQSSVKETENPLYQGDRSH
ncbi:hypothetical protein CAOG_05058 [Capsaspora owczarzaki ATCC 30864]|uniref:Integrin beta n=2 Tax=Capsaspora owczarzaki TaxID=192875 RepID=A0A0D2WRB3_CAPO3|nr:hypothetical protein CAOG_05058 [Capsaspora owczarzaki ATCC 30864]ADI46543.1 integrin beta 2 [Capsaspora owczarzaki]KJE94415.1 hypothetical protein CAOG_005058 [Capsaspora owczarzaki ATCC 30864]|eukprot:XP_004346743.1 hypothetical protein CAOG_05058 [Capsaspora owczarzaki ATCC 30864]